ncbi:MAG: hypothetical protein ACJAWV_002929 [Flammeovirgaceae bacterium]|jgi:hypothetical protein
MEYHLKFNALATYVENFAKQVCDRAYSDGAKVDGRELVQLTPSPQINSFLVQAVFEKWQEESKNIQSPFFDYKAQTVQEKLNDLMKSLSQHISIARAHLEPMLAQAIFDTFILQFNPNQYFRGLFNNLSSEASVKKELQPMLKYVKFHQSFLEKLYTALLAEGETVTADMPLKIASRVGKNETLFDGREKAESNMESIQKELPFEFNDLISNWKVEEVVPEIRGVIGGVLPVDHPDFDEEEDSAIEIDESFAEKTAHYDEEDYLTDDRESAISNEEDLLSEGEVVGEEERPITEADMTGRDSQPIDEELESDSEPTLDDDNSDDLFDDSDLDDIELDVEVSTPNVEKAEMPDFFEDDKNEVINLIDNALASNEATEKEGETLLERLGGSMETEHKPTLADKFAPEPEERKSSQLKGSIPLNMKFQFQNELFGGNNTEFNDAVDMIDECKDYHTAISLLKEKYLRKHDWDLSASTTRDFLNLVDQKFD